MDWRKYAEIDDGHGNSTHFPINNDETIDLCDLESYFGPIGGLTFEKDDKKFACKLENGKFELDFEAKKYKIVYKPSAPKAAKPGWFLYSK